jgi:threonine dehydratase
MDREHGADGSLNQAVCSRVFAMILPRPSPHASVISMTPSPIDIEAAAARIASRVRRTPLLRLADDELGLGYSVTLKLELLQHAGSFKPRGAFNRILSARESGELPRAGVIAASGGNHGAAVAFVARALGLPAEIFVPELTPPEKRARIESFGARLVRTGATYAEALEASRARRAETGAMEVHAYDHPMVLAGQGTAAREFEQDAPDLTHMLVATGGGGLIGGMAAWYRGRVRLISVEPAACPALHDALRAGRPVASPVGGVAADSLGARQVGALMFPIAAAHVAKAVLVADDAIRAAQRLLWDRLRLIAEPGGATALAALLSGAWNPPAGARVGVLVCGSNADPATVVP